MADVPLKAEILGFEDGTRPRDWGPRRGSLKGPLRLIRLCLLGTFLPGALVLGPIYLRYRVFAEQMYPVAASDQRMIDGKMSTTWCQRQLVKVNGTFNAYLLGQQPEIRAEPVPVSMTRHLILEDDMKEYWGFYLLRGSSVTVSTCVRWPGASLTIIRGHKHLHECAFIGDDSSEELEELVEVAQERGILNFTFTTSDGLSNEPEKMKRARVGVQFHDRANAIAANHTLPDSVMHQLNSQELDAKTMRNILTQLFAKTLDTKKKQKENPHHHYEGTFRESSNIDRPPILAAGTGFDEMFDEDTFESIDQIAKPVAHDETSISRAPMPMPMPTTTTTTTTDSTKSNVVVSSKNLTPMKSDTTTASVTPHTVLSEALYEAKEVTLPQETSSELFDEILERINSLGSRGKNVLRKLMDEIEPRDEVEKNALHQMVERVAKNDRDEELTERERSRKRREIILSSLLSAELNADDSENNLALEEGVLNPDGIAEDRGTVDENTMNDRSNSEFWSSFSSSEERLLQCNGLILNLPLTPHRRCTPKYESKHAAASLANTVTYRVPSNGYYFFVLSSENEIQPNYIRIGFDLQKTTYDTSNPIRSCKNSTVECSLPLNFFSNQRTVLELPVTGNDSQWNHEYVVVSTCEPRTAIYILCIVLVPLLVLVFAFH